MKKADLIYADSEHSADLLYACGFRAPDAFIYFADNREKGVILSALERDRGEKECHQDIAVYGTEDFSEGIENGTAAVIMSLARKRNISEFRVPSDFPLGLADYLRETGLVVMPEQGSFFPQRKFKSNDEAADIEHALEITEQGMYRAMEILSEATVNNQGILEWKHGELTSDILRSEINIALIRGGAMPDATIVACGLQAAEPHNLGSGPLYAGKSIIIDIFPRVIETGYWGDLTRTFVKGKAPAIVKKAFDAVLEARESAKEMIKPGANCAEIHIAANKILEKHGFLTGRQDGRNFGFFHGLGHSVGLEIHEEPRLSPRCDHKLIGGEVLTVEPGVYYPEWGGIRLEDMVFVTSDGCKCLTGIETFLEIE
jgi:Xaa-Pro aminopeptidase